MDKITVSEAIDVIKLAMLEYPDYRNIWKANIAMAFKDEFNRSYMHEGLHKISNTAADNFLNLLFKEPKIQKHKDVGLEPGDSMITEKGIVLTNVGSGKVFIGKKDDNGDKT